MTRRPLPPIMQAPLVRLADLRCAVCAAPEPTIICVGPDAIGPVYCGPICARSRGWPWLASETLPPARRARP